MTNIMPVTFLNKDGCKLFGILHRPSGSGEARTGIVILSPGIKSRVAPHRLYVKMARCFAEMGYPVLRFDFYGLGDSEGEISERQVADFYGSVQVGRYINDTLAAMDWMEREQGIREFILTGLCGGAITGLLAGAGDRRVRALLGLGIPVILDSANAQHDKYITAGQLDQVMKGTYFRNLLKWKSWLRFLTFRSDYRLIFKGLMQTVRKRLSGTTKEPVPNSVVAKAAQELDNFNRLFPDALRKMLATDRKIFFLFSEADRLYWEFREKYLERYRSDVETYGANLSWDVTKNANHIFSFKEWQKDMLDKTRMWLNPQFRK